MWIARLSAYRVPGTSVFIALGLLLGGKRVEAARLAAVIFGSFAAHFMYLFTRRVACAVIVGRWICMCALSYVGVPCQEAFCRSLPIPLLPSIAC